VFRGNTELALRTARLILVPLAPLHEAEHAQASGDAAAALRDTRAAEAQWREHGFGPWAIRDRRDDSFLGGAELITEGRRNEGLATEAMLAAIDDLWRRAGVERIMAYIEGENEPSLRLAARLGFAVRGQGRGRSGEPMTVYELRRLL
jgi:RimJ/RimL family protein N-acetyltransferase